MTDTTDTNSDPAAEAVAASIPERCPVTDLATDYDMFDPEYLKDPFSAWAELRDTCPIAHTERYGGSWLPTKYDDLQAMAKMVPVLSSKSPIVIDMPRELFKEDGSGYNAAAPISADPPEQNWTRRALLPHFTPKAIAPQTEYTQQLCHDLIDGFIDKGGCDAAVDYAQQIPPRIIAHKLGVDAGMVDDFIEWVRGVLELGLQQPELRAKYSDIIRSFFAAEVADRRANPKDDLITALCQTEVDGEFLPDEVVIGMCNLQLVAGIDTTWSSIGSALWHFAGHGDDRRRPARERHGAGRRGHPPRVGVRPRLRRVDRRPAQEQVPRRGVAACAGQQRRGHGRFAGRQAERVPEPAHQRAVPGGRVRADRCRDPGPPQADPGAVEVGAQTVRSDPRRVDRGARGQGRDGQHRADE